jgi:hypothetical protein
MDYNTFDKAEELLLTRNMNELSNEDRMLLAEQFGDMEQAGHYREFLLQAQKELSPSSPDIPEPVAFTAVKVRSRMREIKRGKEESRTWWRTLIYVLNYRVRIYQSGIAMLAVVGMMFFITNKSNISDSMNTDTLYADSSAVMGHDRGDTVVGGR